jgi:hypothetical protein
MAVWREGTTLTDNAVDMMDNARALPHMPTAVTSTAVVRYGEGAAENPIKKTPQAVLPMGSTSETST